MLTISSVDSLEAKLNQAQDDLGIPHHGRVSITYRSNQDTGYVCVSLCAFVLTLQTINSLSPSPSLPFSHSLSLPLLPLSLPSQILVSDGIQWSSSCLVLVHILFTAEGCGQKESFLQIQSICKHVTSLSHYHFNFGTSFYF